MRRLAAGFAIVVLGVAWLARPAPGAALVNGTITVSSSPNPSVTLTTIEIVVKFAAPVTNVRIWLYRHGGYHGPNECNPACNFFGLDGSPTWDFPEASGTITMTFLTNAQPGATDVVNHDGFSADSVALREKYPTVTTTLTRTPTGVLMPGASLHITVKTTTNAGPMSAELYVELPAGVSAPTSMSSGVVYEGWHGVHKFVTLDLSASYSFDVEVEAPVGTKLTFSAYFSQKGGWDPGDTMAFTVGVSPTPKPTATPGGTRAPSPSAVGSVAPSVEGQPSPSPSDPASTGSPAASPTGAGSPSPVPSADAPAPSPLPTERPDIANAGTDAGGGFVLGLAAALVVGLGGLGIVRLAADRGRAPGRSSS